MKRRRRAPVFHLIAGPNGAGKTTFARRYLPGYAHTLRFLNADEMARGLSPLEPESEAIRAGRMLLAEFERCASTRCDFATESTLSGMWLVPRLERLRRDGYRLLLYYLWIPSHEFARRRVLQRTLTGGHNIPAGVIERRFHAGLEKFRSVYPAFFQVTRVFDNSGAAPVLVAWKTTGSWRIRDSRRWRVMGGMLR